MKTTSAHKLFRLEKRAKPRAKFMSQDSGRHINLSVFPRRQSTLPFAQQCFQTRKRNGPDPSRLSGVAHAAIITYAADMPNRALPQAKGRRRTQIPAHRQ
jgi:hypothetical protein